MNDDLEIHPAPRKYDVLSIFRLPAFWRGAQTTRREMHDFRPMGDLGILEKKTLLGFDPETLPEFHRWLGQSTSPKGTPS